MFYINKKSDTIVISYKIAEQNESSIFYISSMQDIKTRICME